MAAAIGHALAALGANELDQLFWVGGDEMGRPAVDWSVVSQVAVADGRCHASGSQSGLNVAQVVADIEGAGWGTTQQLAGVQNGAW